MFKKITKFALLGIWLTLGLASAWGQTASSILGTVTDASGAVVPGATVTVVSLETGATLTTTSNAQGNYAFLSLPLGAQEVRAAMPGFKTAVRQGIDLEVGQQARVDLRLEPGQASQQVTVTAAGPVVNTTTASVAGMVSTRQIEDLPLNGRSFDELITLNPGTVNFVLKSANTTTSNGNTFSVAGRQPSENLFLLNGVEYTGSSKLQVTPGGVSGELLGLDAVREFNVVTDAYSAAYGKRAGAQIRVVTKSGTNQVHGDAFEFLRNSALDARNAITEPGAVPAFRRNQFGGSLGGALVKDRVFLFGSYEGFRQLLMDSSKTVVPDAQARQGLLPDGNGNYAPVSNLDPAMLKYMAFWPQPGQELMRNGQPSGTALSFNTARQTVREDFANARLDYLFSARNTLSGVYTIDDGTSLLPRPNPLFGTRTDLRSQVASVQDVHIVSPNLLNTFTGGFSRAAWVLDADNYVGFPGDLSYVANQAPGATMVGGLTSAGPLAAGARDARNLFTWADTVQYTRGRHDFSAGVWFQRLQDNDDANTGRLGGASFTNLTRFLQGTVTSFSVTPNPTPLAWRSLFSAWFVQDSFRLLPRLTVSLGYRQEASTGWNEAHGHAANFVTGASGALETNPMVGNSVFSKNNARHLAGPRAGFAWDVFGDGRTALRGGYGLYHSMMDALSFNLDILPPFNTTVGFEGVSLPSIVPVTRGLQPPPPCGPGVAQPCSTYEPRGIQADAKTPAVQEWNLTWEQQLSSNTALRVGYQGSFGVHGLVTIDPNSIPGEVCQSAAGCTAGGTPAKVTATVPEGTYYIPVGSRPNPYMSAGFMWYAEGNSSYNALLVDVSRRMSHGLQLRGNFTWAKNLDINSAATGAQANNEAQMVMDRTHLRRDWGPSALTPARQLSISALYELPFGQGRRWMNDGGGVVNLLAGGWELSEMTTVLSGFPVTPQIGSNRSGDGDTRNPDRPDLNSTFTGSVIIGSSGQWFNPAAYALPTVGTYGNAGRGILSGPGLANVDLSLLKSFVLSEGVNAEFRAEFFNILNHTNLGTPNASVFTGTQFSPAAGLITSTATDPRQIQFGLKLSF